MPKRGGGGGQRYNNNAGNGGGNNGGGVTGSRFSALKDYDGKSAHHLFFVIAVGWLIIPFTEVDDHQRRKDRNKRRVSFKTSLFNQKSDVKLRLQDVRRWDEDDDMSEMTTTVKVRLLRLYKSSSFNYYRCFYIRRIAQVRGDEAHPFPVVNLENWYPMPLAGIK